MLNRIVLGTLVCAALIGCKDRKPQEAPPPPAPAIDAAVAPVAPVAIDAAPADPFLDFAGFSKDGTSFAWVSPSPTLPDLIRLEVIAVGQIEPSMDFVDTPESRRDAEAKLAAGFSATRTPAPADLTIDAALTATPPTMALVRAGKRIEVPIGAYPYPPSDVAELWGVAADGKHVAIHIHGKDVPGVLTTGEGGTFHFYFVAPMP